MKIEIVHCELKTVKWKDIPNGQYFVYSNGGDDRVAKKLDQDQYIILSAYGMNLSHAFDEAEFFRYRPIAFQDVTVRVEL